jgi:hypothetical protein
MLETIPKQKNHSTTAARIIGMKFRSFEFNTNVGKEGEALRCKNGHTCYQKIMLHIE